MFVFTVVPLCASVTDLFPESIPIDFWWIVGRFVIDLGSIFRNLDRIVNGFVVVLGHLLWTDVCKCVFLNLQINKQGSDEICQDLPRSNKIHQRIGKHKPASATCRNESRNAKPQNEGAAVSRRMASSIRSGPVGARGVFNSKIAFPNLLYIYYINFLPRIYPIRRILWC